jgi:hypothetical protein
LLGSIAERGIEEPLEGVDTPEGRFLLNGFKRRRCALKLGIASVPYVSLGAEEATGIVNLMRVSTDTSMGILEQARFILDLLTIHGMNVAEVAGKLSRSKAWVSMRRGLLQEMSLEIQAILFRGAFPVYCYMYTLRPFRRMNAVPPDRTLHEGSGREAIECAGDRTLGAGLLPWVEPTPGSDRRRQAGLVAGPIEKRPRGPGRVQ